MAGSRFRTLSLPVLGLAGAGFLPLALGGASLNAQAAGQPPSNYKGPNLYAICVYLVGDTSFYSNVFSTSGYFKFKAQDAFHQYAVAQAKGAALRGSGCRWSTSQEEVTAQKTADKKLLGQPGRSAKGVETGWVFNAAAAAPATTAVASNAHPSSTAVTGGSGTSRTAGSSGGSGTSTSGSVQQAAAGSFAGTKAAANSSMSDAVTTTMGSATTGASSAIQGLFKHHGSDSSKAAAPGTPSTGAGGGSQAPAPLGMENTESPLAATAEAQHVEGLIADVSGADLIVNVGSAAGVRVGTTLAVMHPVRTVKDPATGKVLRTIEDKLGDLVITSADANSAEGVFTGATPPKVGDLVRTPTP